MDVLIVAVIVGFAAWYLIRTSYRKWKKVDEGCSCSSCGSCTACCPVIREKQLNQKI